MNPVFNSRPKHNNWAEPCIDCYLEIIAGLSIGATYVRPLRSSCNLSLTTWYSNISRMIHSKVPSFALGLLSHYWLFENLSGGLLCPQFWGVFLSSYLPGSLFVSFPSSAPDTMTNIALEATASLNGSCTDSRMRVSREGEHSICICRIVSIVCSLRGLLSYRLPERQIG